MKDSNKLLRSFLAKLCEKNYSSAENLLQKILVEKMTKRIKDKHKKVKEKMSKDDDE